MALGDILNADMATVGAELRRGFAWWTGELQQLVPAGLRGGLGRGGRTVGYLSADEGSISLVRGGRSIPLGSGTVKAVVAIHPKRVLVRPLQLPRLSPRDARAMVALDLDRLTPLKADELWHDVELGEADSAAPLHPARLAVVPRATAEAALALAAANGIEPTGLAVADVDGDTSFDFLPAIRAAGAPPPWWASARTWWTVAGVLLAANIGFAIYRDVADVRRLRDLTMAQQDAVTLAQRIRGRVAQEDRRRAAMVAERERREPLAVIAAANALLPQEAWAQRFQWDGARMRLSGFAPPAFDSVTALRKSAAFREPRAEAGELSAANNAFPPFDVSAAFMRGEAP